MPSDKANSPWEYCSCGGNPAAVDANLAAIHDQYRFRSLILNKSAQAETTATARKAAR